VNKLRLDGLITIGRAKKKLAESEVTERGEGGVWGVSSPISSTSSLFYSLSSRFPFVPSSTGEPFSQPD